MWIFTTIGFYSLTQSKHEPGMMHFRGRERVDLENLCDRFQIDRQSIVETPKADYRFRLVLPPLQAVQIVTALAQDIDYSNFKDAVHRNPTQARKGGAYMRVWSTMHALQPPRDPMEGYPMLWEHAGPDERVLSNPKARKPRGKRAENVRQSVAKFTLQRAVCPDCQRTLAVQAPKGADGSLDVFPRHRDGTGAQCPRSRRDVKRADYIKR